MFARNLPGVLARRGGVFKLSGRHEQSHGIGETTSESGVALGNDLPLEPVTGEERRSAPTLDHRRQLPAEIDRILDCGVVAEATGRREKMRGIASDKNSSARELFSNQRVSCVPVRAQ